MSANQQALLMASDNAVAVPEACEADPYYSCGPTNDPYWANVVLLLHMDSDYMDSSSYAHTITNSGCAITTSEKQFGSGALQANGTSPGGGGNNSLETALHTAFDINTGDWTIECFGYLNTSVTAVYSTLVRLRNSGGSTVITLALKSGTESEIYVKNGSGILVNISISTGIVAGSWFHMAVTRQGTTVRFFVDGVLLATSTISVGVSESVRVAIGNNAISSTVGWDGFIDDLRITKGIARYTADFDVPTEAFPNQ